MKKAFLVIPILALCMLGLTSNAFSYSFTDLWQETYAEPAGGFVYPSSAGASYGAGLGNYIGTGDLGNYGEPTVEAFFLESGFASVEKIGIDLALGDGGYAGYWDVNNGGPSGDFVTYLMVKGGNTGFSLHEYDPAAQSGAWNVGYLGLNSNDINFQMSFVRAYNTGSPVPEPATMLLLGTGLVGLAGLRPKFKK